MDERNSILIVDDEKSNISILKSLLKADYTVYAATKGQEAIETAEEFVPDLILLDVLMPEMDGYAVFSELKKREKTRNIPVIFITGLTGSENEEKGLILGAVDYIPKPFSSIIAKLRIGNQIKIINQIRTINNISNTDQLTGIANRRSFDNFIDREWKRSVREKIPVSILLLDADNFKNYNDTYGHQQGDVVLQMIAGILKLSLKRPTDIAARWGGEEFAVLLPNTDINGAMEVAELIRAQIESTAIPLLGGQSTMITVSVGVNTVIPEVDSVMSEFVDRADKALYAAKAAGKNKVFNSEQL